MFQHRRARSAAAQDTPDLGRRAVIGAGTVLAAAAAAGAARGQGLPEAAARLPAGSTGRPMPSLLREPPLEPGRRVGWAVVGLGRYAVNQILPNFAESRLSRPVSLVSGNRDKAAGLAARYGIESSKIYGYDDFDRIAADEAIQVVYIVLPNALHADYAVRALRAGKHVLCEKPLCVSVEQGEAMLRAAREADRKLMTAYRCHYEPYNLKAIELIREGAVGRPRLVTTSNASLLDPDDASAHWRMRRDLAGGGALLDVGVYGVNGARYLLGEEPTEIRAMMHSAADDPRFREVEDVVTWQLRFPSGAVAQGGTGYSFSDSRFAVQGDKATLMMDPATSYYRHEMRLGGSNQQQQFNMPEGNQFAAMLDHMSSAVRDNTPVLSTGEEGLQDVRLMLKIYEAAREGRPVRVDWQHRNPFARA